MQRLRIGIVGCGEVTQILHLPSLYQLNDRFQVTALCDVSASALEEVGTAWGVRKRFHAYQDLVAQDDVDVVVVANPNAYHSQVTLAAIAAGKHVLVEKPMCLTLREADEIIAAARRQPGLVVQVGYMRRYAPAFLAACRMVSELGELRLARVHDVIGQNAIIINNTSWVARGKDVPAGVIAAGQRLQDDLLAEAIGASAPPELRSAYNLLLGLSSHDTSTMRELLGMPKGVLYAAQRHGGRSLTAAFDYGGYVCHFETSVDVIPRFDAHLEVYGEERVLRVQYDTPYVRNIPIRLFVTESNGAGGLTERSEHTAWGDPFASEWKAFYENVTGQKEPKTSPADFRCDLEIFRDMIALMREE